MSLTKEQVAKTLLGVAIIIPCAIAGKFVGAGLGAVVGGMYAFKASEVTYDWVRNKFTH